MAEDAEQNVQILEAQAEFALKMMREVSKRNESMVVSPISAAIALAMAYAGAKGETAQEMGQVLAKGAPESEIHEFFGQLLKTINDGEKCYTLEMANKVYLKSGFEPLEAFKTAITSHYGGNFESVDFSQNVDTAKKINYFVEQTTSGKIRDLVNPDMFNGLTRLVLVNAIYFNGRWRSEFDEEDTKKKPFYMFEGKQEEIDMMHNTDMFIYHENDELPHSNGHTQMSCFGMEHRLILQLMGMPYKGDDTSMFLVLPKKRFGLDELLANMTGASLLEMLQIGRRQFVKVMVPKFKLESTHDLSSPLANIGMLQAFSDSANFSGITEDEPLKISKVVQKTFIDINEEGTEAAAATDAPSRVMCARRPGPPPVFHADHPFALFLCDEPGTVFFGAIFRGKMS